VYIDGSTYTASGTSVSARSGNYGFAIAQILGGSIEALQVTSESSPASNYGFVPLAVLDPSLNTLQVVPEISGDPWATIQQIADAELAVGGFNGAGLFQFRNRTTLSTFNVARTITSSTSLSALEISVGSETFANRVQVPYTPWAFADAGLAWSLDAPQVVRAGRTRQITVNTDNLVTGLDPSFSVLTNGSTNTDGNSYYRASVDKAGTSERTGGVHVSLTQTTSSQFVITIANSGTQDCWMVSPSNYTDIPVGTPSLWIGGVAVTQANTLVSDTGPVAAGEVAYQFPQSDWVQDSDTADTLAADLLGELAYPTPQLTNLEIIPDPRLELMDMVEIVEPDFSHIDEYAVIWGMTTNLSASTDDQGAVQITYTQTVDARPIAPPGAWLLGVPGRSELGTTTYLY
jgi:hypothetical protein